MKAADVPGLQAGFEPSTPDATLDSRRDRFVAIGEIAAEIAHELRNALQVVSANVYLARKDPAASEPYLAKIDRSTRLAQSIVDDLMALSRGEMAPSTPITLVELLGAVREPLAEATYHDTFDRSLIIHARLGLATRLLHALYDNAIRVAAPARAAITTSAWREGHKVVVEVADDGPGVPEALSGRLFEPLVTSRPGGTGLGLSLARRIADAHGGTLELVPSTKGAKFRWELPA